MDPKATAKSKRVHSLHGRRNNPTAAAKKASSSSVSASATGAQAKREAPRPGRRPDLPSNWDRYDDDDDDSNEMGGEKGEASSAAMAQGTEILAKSKGADYMYLIEQARSQPQPIASFPDEFAFDILQGSSTMLSARGEMLLSYCEDDNFIVDDYDSSSNYQVSFLSMDLNALARQLSKLKMSQRLFMEDDDLFMEETLLTASKENSSEKPKESATASACTIAEKENASTSEITVEKIQSLASTSESPIETELDMLIDSFEETKISRELDNSTKASVVLPENKAASSLDDMLDDLLAGTDLSVNERISEGDSSKREKMANLDELIDDFDLKMKTPIELSVNVSSNSVPTKRVDDFDSWFDSL